MQVHVTDWKCW